MNGTGEGGPPDLDDAMRLAALHLRHPAPSDYDGLDALITVCADTVPGVDAVAVSHTGRGRVHSTHRTHPAVAAMDAWYHRTGRGPLLPAAAAGPAPLTVFLVDDLGAPDDDGPVDLGLVPPFRGLHSTTLRSRHGHRTALDLYATTPDVLGPETTVLADMFARRASSLLYDAREPRTVRRGLALGLVGRALDLSRREAEQLLEPLLRAPTVDPVTVAELLLDHLDGRSEQ